MAFSQAEATARGSDKASGPSSGRSFTCSLCQEIFRVDYHGRKPPFCPQLVFMEDVFCMKDPFSVGGEEGENRKCLPTILGGTCAVCSKDVCAQCSLFYAVRLCGCCARKHRSRLPKELQRTIDATGQTRVEETRQAGLVIGTASTGVSKNPP